MVYNATPNELMLVVFYFYLLSIMSFRFLKSLTIPKFELPPFVSKLGNKFPQWPHNLAFTTALNALHKMKLFPEDSLVMLTERSIFVDVEDTGGQICFTYSDGSFRPIFLAPEVPDVAFRSNLSAFLRLLARQEDPDTLFFNRELAIEGDTELGLILKNMFDSVEWPSISTLLSHLAYRH